MASISDRWKVNLLCSSLVTCWIMLALSRATCHVSWFVDLSRTAYAVLVGAAGVLTSYAIPACMALFKQSSGWPTERWPRREAFWHARLLGVAMAVVFGLLLNVMR
jgi:hypothetical protein